jgi:hypothetical protein
MAAISHKNIKRFFLEGEIYDESAIPRIKDQYIRMLNDLMHCKGYLPRIDIDPDFTVMYNGKTFEFKLSSYGVYVGKRKCEIFLGLDKNRLILKPTTKNKSEESYNPVV